MHGRHVPEVAIGAAISIYGLVSLASRIPAGAVYRSHRAWWLIAAGCLVSSLAFAGITRTAHPALLTFFVALDGAGFAIASTANMAALIDRRPRRRERRLDHGLVHGQPRRGLRGRRLRRRRTRRRARARRRDPRAGARPDRRRRGPLDGGPAERARARGHGRAGRARRLVARLPPRARARLARVLRHALHQPRLGRAADVLPDLRARDRALADADRHAPGRPRGRRGGDPLRLRRRLPRGLLPARAAGDGRPLRDLDRDDRRAHVDRRARRRLGHARADARPAACRLGGARDGRGRRHGRTARRRLRRLPGRARPRQDRRPGRRRRRRRGRRACGRPSCSRASASPPSTSCSRR